MAQIPLFKLQPNSQQQPLQNTTNTANNTSPTTTTNNTNNNNATLADKYKIRLEATQSPLKPTHTHSHYYNHHNHSGSHSSSNTEYEVISMGSGGSTSLANDCSVQHNRNQHHHQQQHSPPNGTKSCSHLFEICVDCYQMMEGVVVSANEADLALTTNAPNGNVVHYRKVSPVQETGFTYIYI
jgi:hypothetical protein